MQHRVSPTDRIRGHIDELLASGKQPDLIGAAIPLTLQK